jgi:hypothetical protein
MKTTVPLPDTRPDFFVRPLSERDGYVFNFFAVAEAVTKAKVAEVHGCTDLCVRFREGAKLPLIGGGYRYGYTIETPS